MSIPGTVPITGQLAPTETTDTYPTHDTQYGRGGVHHVADITARNNIPAERRVAGMLCTVESDGKIYRLATNLTDWVELVTGGSGSVVVELVCGAASISGHKLVTVDNLGLAVVASNDDITHLGRLLALTTGAVVSAETFNAVISGTVTEPSWTWTIGDTLYLGTNGTIVPYSGIGTPLWEIAIGTAVAPTKIALNITTTSITRA